MNCPMYPIARATRYAGHLLALLCVAACGGGAGDGGGGPPPAEVSVAEVVQRSIIEWDEFTGRVEAIERIELRPRVAGYLSGVHFEDGAIVEKGDLLFTIDDREYRAAVALAEANVSRAATRLELAEQELARSEKLIAARAVSVEELNQRQGEAKQARADLVSARAELDQAQLSLGFSRISAPIRGRISDALEDVGNLVTPGETLLATLVSIDPVHVTFEGDERIYLKYQAQARKGERPSSREAPNPVQVGLASDDDFPFRGTMDYVDNAVDPSTGTIRGRALLDNPDGLLIPGLFTRVRLLGSGEYEALLIHDVAVLTDQDRKYVYVVGDDNTAQRRDVELGRSVEGLRVIKRGLQPGERVVVNGVRKIFFPGAPVVPTVVPMDAPMTKTSGPGPAESAANGS